MAAAIVPSASPGLLDLWYDGDPSPSGCIDARMSGEILRIILALAQSVRGSFPDDAQKADCRYASAAWARSLSREGVEAQDEGGVGVDEEQVTSDWKLVPSEERSGYRRANDDQIHLHFWLLLGPEHLLFDPTAHQFDDKGGVAIEQLHHRRHAIPSGLR